MLVAHVLASGVLAATFSTATITGASWFLPFVLGTFFGMWLKGKM